MHPHRHPHQSMPGKQAQNWHKDSYFGRPSHSRCLFISELSRRAAHVRVYTRVDKDVCIWFTRLLIVCVTVACVRVACQLLVVG